MAGSGPRRPHPPPTQPPAVARVTPMVPEVSLFFSGGSGVGAVGSRHVGWNNNYEPLYKSSATVSVAPSFVNRPTTSRMSPLTPALHNSSGGLMAARSQPPSPHQPLLQGILKPTPDFSRIFDTSLSLCDTSNEQRQPSIEDPYVRPDKNNAAIHFSDQVQVQATPALAQDNTSGSGMSHRANSSVAGLTVGVSTTSHAIRSSQSTVVGENISPSRPATTIRSAADSPSASVPPEILRVLNWQNDQLKLLQEQVRLLLDSSPHRNCSDYSSQQHHQQQQVHQQQNNQQQLQHQHFEQNVAHKEAQMTEKRQMSSVATNTSSLWPEIQQGLARLQQIVEQEEEEGAADHSSSFGEINKENIPVDQSGGETLRSPPLSLHLDLPDYGGSECSPDLRHKAFGSYSWESPVLGESVSMYEAEEAVAVQDILSQVKRLLADPLPAAPVPDSQLQAQKDDTADESSRPSTAAVSGQLDPAAATLARLRQLGVSFISPEDLRPSNVAAAGGVVIDTGTPLCNPAALHNPYNSIFLPQAAGASLWNSSGTSNISPDTSLEINSLALKYLDDAQLSRLADQYRSNNKNNSNNDNIASNGARDLGSGGQERTCVDLSLATQEFLHRHGLAEGRPPLREVNRGETVTPPKILSGGRHLLSFRRPLAMQQRRLVPAAHAVAAGQQTLQRRVEPPATRGQPELSNRILDITAIKQQPKLL